MEIIDWEFVGDYDEWKERIIEDFGDEGRLDRDSLEKIIHMLGGSDQHEIVRKLFSELED